MREELQQIAVKKVLQNKCTCLEWATGVGKSKAAIEVYKALTPSLTYIIVPEDALIKNWELEFHKYNIEMKNIKIFCYASLHKYLDRTPDLMILDEVHHAFTDIRKDKLSKLNNCNKIVCLSATLDEEDYNDLETLFKVKPATIKVTLTKAIEVGILPEPKIFLLELELDRLQKKESVIFKRGKTKEFKNFDCDYSQRWKYLKDDKLPNLCLDMKCTQKEAYEELCNRYEFAKKRYFRSKQDYDKNKWLQIGSERKRMLGNFKTEIAEEVCRILNNKRFVCFCSSINQANYIGKENAINSEIEGCDKIIAKFNNGEINSIYPVGMIQEGQNLNNVEAGIIIQLDGTERAFIQKFGRSLRAKAPIQIILYYKGTKDEEYLMKALEDIPREYIIKLKDVEELRDVSNTSNNEGDNQK